MRNVNALRERKTMFEVTTFLILLAFSLTLISIFRGPTVYDRIISANSFGTLTVLFLSILGYLLGRPEFIDLAIIYAILNVISAVAILKYFRQGDLSKSDDGWMN